jgi:hypothetical protein
LKKDAQKIKLILIFSAIISILTDILPNLLGLALFPKIAIITYIFPVVTVFLTLKN